MSIALSHPRSLFPPIARSGDGAFFANGVGNGMADSPEASPQQVARIISYLGSVLPLTPRQAEVLHWMAEGKSNDEIATIVACSYHTVKTHVKEIFQRLGAHNRTAAASCAYRALQSCRGAQPASPERAIPKKRRAR